MKDYTIRSTETGAVICTGYHADNEDAALEEFYSEFPVYKEGEAYAAEAGWND